MKKILTALLLASVLVACTDPEGTRKALEAQGFTDVVVGGYAFSGCSDSDDTATKFTATNPRGERVSDVMCCGLGPFSKACTVRW